MSELSQYDAAWCHIFESQNHGELRRASWDDFNLPARLGTYAAAGLPWLLKENRGSQVAVNNLARKLPGTCASTVTSSPSMPSSPGW